MPLKPFAVLITAVVLAACTGRDAPPVPTKAERIATADPDVFALGKAHYTDYCAVCHMDDGSGVAELYPPMTGSDILNSSTEDLVHFLVTLERKVPAKTTYPPSMGEVNYFFPEDMAALVTYITLEFGERGGQVSPEDVAPYMQ